VESHGLFVWQDDLFQTRMVPFEYFYSGAADARDEFLSALRDFHFEMARAAHFRALQNGQCVAGALGLPFRTR